MPIYEYSCLDCHHQFETIRPMRDADAPLPCPQCNSEQVKRGISVFCAVSNGQVVAGSSSSCGSCAGGSCASCGSH